MISPKIEESRIRKALRDCEEHGFEILEPMECIEKAVEQFGDSLAVSCSFGSCSVVVLHIALQFDPNIKVVFNNTGVEYPETYAYRDLLKKKWSLNLIETKPIKSFWQCVKEYGFPLIRSKAAWEKTRKVKNPSVRPECCIYLKEKPMKKAISEYQINATLTGLRCAESRLRMFTLGQRGQYYHTKEFGDLWRYHPIGFWNRKQVWQYLEDNKIPVNQIYLKGKDRSGCMPCTGFLNWEKELSKANPKMYRYVQKLRGVSLIDDFIALENETIDRCGVPRQQLLEDWF